MSTFYYELFFGKTHFTPSDWEGILNFLEWYVGLRGGWRILLQLEVGTIHYYLEVPLKLPLKTTLSSIMFAPIPIIPKLPDSALRFSPTLHFQASLKKAIERIAHFDAEFTALEINFSIVHLSKISRVRIYYKQQNQIYHSAFVVAIPAQLLSFDFSNPHGYQYKKIPQTLRFDKIVPFLSLSSDHAILKIPENFHQDYFLTPSGFDFATHSLILGESGSGKSKFVAHLIEEIYNTSSDSYHIVVFDPHDSLKHDFTNIDSQKILNFNSPKNSINLFISDRKNQASNAELFLSLMRSLMRESFNSRLERVLRFGFYLLSTADELSLQCFRNLLLDADYRNQLCSKYRKQLASNVVQFFLTEFSIIKSQFYDQAIAPVISFLDEIQMLPAFNVKHPTNNFADVLKQNFLTTLSFNVTKLGLKSTQIITGFLMQQIFQLATSNAFSRHLIVVIDEISILENPILNRVLSELRKYHVSVILIGQYFGQIGQPLREAILANTVNYFIFRVSKADAIILGENLQYDFTTKKTPVELKEEFTNLLTKQNTCECLVKVRRHGINYPTFRAHTINHSAPPYLEKEDQEYDEEISKPQIDFSFDFHSDISIEQVMQSNSTNRKRIIKEQDEHRRKY